MYICFFSFSLFLNSWCSDCLDVKDPVSNYCTYLVSQCSLSHRKIILGFASWV